jgi:hypothetical protein
MVVTCDYLDNTACESKCTSVQVSDSCIPPVFAITAYEWIGKFRDSRDRLTHLPGKIIFKSCIKDNSGFKRLICNEFYGAGNGTIDDRVLL